MGCDIHFIIEKRFETSDGNRWIGVFDKYETPRMRTDKEPVEKPEGFRAWGRDSVFGNRWYAFFAALAGVRGDGPEPNGLPEDISELAQAIVDEYGEDGHSHSHLPYREFCHRYSVLTGEVFKDADIEYLSGLNDSEIDAYRVVFFFDN
jgi:hypothetical protein